MLKDGKLWIGLSKGDGAKRVSLLPGMANRHGLIAGATGTGKTITLKVMAEAFSDLGVPVFMADVKGDLASMCQPGAMTEDMARRIEKFGLEGFELRPYPTCIWDVLGEQGHPLRTTVSDMGPVLLSSLLELNETQSGILSIIFKIADDEGLLLIDIKDLRLMIEHVGENARDYTLRYGNITKQSLGAITRSLTALEQQGGNQFFGEPALDIRDWMRTDYQGKGYINVLHAVQLIQSPKLYATFLLWLMSELFEELPEVGDGDRPRMIFFFDEAHLLFSTSSKGLLQKIEQVVKLIRSKGVGIYFVTQSPSDVPDEVLGQLGNRVQHALRAYTPADQKRVKVAAQTFRANPAFSTEEVITALGTGEALISFLDEEGKPSIVEECKVLPPQSRMGTIDMGERDACLFQDGLGAKYDVSFDRESAFEILSERFEEAERLRAQAEEEARLMKEEKERAKEELARAREEERARREAERIADRERREREREERELQRARAQEERERQKKLADLNRIKNTAINTITRDVTRSLLRGIMGTFKK